MTETELDVAGTLQRVAEIQRKQLHQAALLPEIRARVAARATRRPLRQIWLTAGGALAAATAAAVLVVHLAGTGPQPLTFTADERPGRAGDTIDAAKDTVRVRFSDGTNLDLQRGAQLLVRSVEPNGARLALERGSVDVSVVHTAAAHWLFDAGPYHVAVTGTRFALAWDAVHAELAVIMHEGSVDVTGDGTTRRASLRAGQSLRASPERFEVADPAAPIPAVAAAPPPAETPARDAMPALGSGGQRPTSSAPAVSRTSRPATGDAWRKLAAAARYPEALRAAEDAGFEAECRRVDRDGLLLLGDVARLARAADRAELAYRTARRRFPHSDRPAFALGLVAFEQRRDFAAAASWFETYLRRFPSGALAREASGRLIEALERGGDRPRARQAAQAYLERYPEGPHATLARRIATP